MVHDILSVEVLLPVKNSICIQFLALISFLE